MGSLRDKYLNKYTSKHEDEEKEKSPYGKKPTVGSDNSGSSIRSSMLDKYAGSGQKEEITSDSIYTFFLDAEDYLSNAKARYSNIGVSTASDAWNKNRKESNNLLARGYSIRDYLSKNKASIDEKSYNAIIKQLDSIDDALRGYTGAFRDARKYYSQWESDEEYLKWKKETEEYEALKNFDVGKGEGEISHLEKILDEYKFHTRWMTDENGEARAEYIRQNYGDEQGIKALIVEKKQYLNRARHIQEGITLAGVINNDDFKAKSGYVSTKSEGTWNKLISDFGMGYDDLTYEYINGEESGMRQEILGKAVSWDTDIENYKVYDQMTDDQISTYNYYYAKDGKEAAEKYLESIRETLNYQAATQRYEKMEGKTALELMFGIEAGLDQFQSGMKNLFNTEDDYIASSSTQMLSGMVREDLADNGAKLPDWLGGASIAQAGYDAITTTSNMAPSILTSIGMNIIAPGSGAVAGTAMMGASAAGNAYQEALNMGYDKDQARGYSTLVGASEAILGYALSGISALGGKLSNKAIAGFLSKIDNAFLRTAAKIGGNMLSEFSEEYLQEVLTPLFSNLALGTDEKINLFSAEALYSGLLGALTAGVMEGPTTIGDAVSIRNTGKQLQNADISATRLAEIGKTFSADTVAYQLAGRVNENTGAYTMGRLFNEIGASLSEQNVTEITNALVAKGMDESTAKKNAKALAYVVEGGQLTDSQIAVIEGNEVLAEVARTTLIDANTTWNQRTNALKALADEMTAPKDSRTNPAQQSQENAPTTDTVGTQNKEGAQSLSEAENADTSPAKVQTISKIENGQVTVNLEDGTEVNVKQADLSVDDGVRIETIAKLDGISPADANFILNTLRTNTNASAQMDSLGAREAYKYGFYGFSTEHMTTHGVFSNSLTEAQRKAIYETGRSVRQRQVDAKQATVRKDRTVAKSGKVHFEGDHSKLTERQSASLTAMEKVADVLGVQIYVFESKLNDRGKRVGANGWYDPKDSSIHIDLHAGENGEGTMLFTAAHELTHHIRKWSPAKFKTLSDFLMQEYGKKGVNVDALVRAQQAKAKRARNYDMSYDEAYEEVVADSMEMMLSDGNVLKRLEKLKAQDKDLWHKIKSFIDDLAAKIKAVYKGMAPDSVEGRHVADMGKAIYRLQELFAEGLMDASDNFQSAMENVVETDAKTVAEDEIITDGAVVTDGEGKKYSIRSMKQDIAEGQMFEDLKTYCGWTQKQVNELRNNLADLVEYMTPYRNILDMNETYGREGRRFSPYKPNSDPLYKISMDFSTLCSKRLLTQYVIENLQLRENRPMSAEEQMAIRAMLNEYRKVEKGLQVACAMCYVEAARLKSPKQITKWMEDPGTQMKNYFADKNPEFANFIKEKQADFKESRGYDRNATKKDMSPKDVRELNKIRPRLRSQYQLSPEDAKIIERAKSLPGSTYLTAGNLASLSETDPAIYAAYTAFVRTATRSKSLETDEPYYYGDSRRDNGNGIIVSDSFIEAVNRENGMRFSSWSDWRIQHLLDYITAVIDNSVRGAAMHGYTKFGEEVRVLGKTGMMFNMSGVAGTQTGLNEDGSLSFSPTESIDVNEAIQLREEFPDTAGLQCIGVGDDHITALLRSDIIDYVIPYHVSGLNAGLRAMANIHGWKDYTSTQHAAIDKSIKLDNAVDKEHWHEEPVYSEFFVGYDTGMTGIEAMRASAARYVRMCKDRGLKPKFEQFVKEDNYWKLLIDRKMVNQKTGKLIQQKPVTPTFDFDTVKSVVDQFVQNYDSGLEARALNHIVENWDSIPKRIRDLKKQGSTKAKKASKAVDTLANQTLAAQPVVEEIKRSDRDNAPTFYSHMAKVVDGVKQEKLGAASVVSMLRGKGVKAEEIKWSGIETWLEGKKSVTKSELQEFIAGSMLQIEEETLDYKERPYTEDQKKRLAEYEAKRDEIVKRVVTEWKRITGEEFPVQNPGYDLESTVSRKIIEANLEYKKASFEGRLLEKLRKDFQKVSENNDDFGFDSWRDALRSVHRHRKDFINDIDVSTDEKAVIVKYCNALNAYNELQNRISEDDSDRLRDIAREAGPWNRKIMEVKHEYNEEAAKHMPKWGGRRYNLEGGKNYREVLFRIPGSTYSNEAMFNHWENRSGILAHARIQDFNTFLGRMLFIEELQSDWHNGGLKYFYEMTQEEEKQKQLEFTQRKREAESELEKVISEMDMELEEMDLAESAGDPVDDSKYTELTKKYNDLRDRIVKAGEKLDNLEKHRNRRVPHAPFADNYHEYVIKRLLRNAAEEGYDSIGWTTADIQSKRWDSKFAKAYSKEYDKDIPNFLNKYGKKWGTRVGKTVLDNGTEVWSMAITDSMKDSVLTEGQPLYSDRDYQDVVSKAVNQFGTTTDFAEAGFILPSGEMLKFTDDKHRGERIYDHRAIGMVYGVDVDLSLNHGFNKKSGKYLDEFVEKGGMRFDAGDPDLNMDIGIQISSTVPLTKAQEQIIRDLVEWKVAREELFEANMTEENFLYSGPLAIRIDFGGNSNYAVGAVSTKDLSAWGKKSLEYEGGQINADRIIADIRHYYKTGETRKPSLVAQFRYSDRDTESVSNRSLLANAFEGVARNDIERQKIQEYKGKISLIEAEERKLQKLNEQIKDLSFSKGPKDTKAIRDLQFEAKQTANRISTYDKQLLRLEASKPLQDVLQREKKMAYQRAEKKGKEALAAYREKTMKTQRELIDKWQESRKKGIENREKTAMRHKIQNVVGELNNLLLSNDKKRHVPDSLKKAVADALDLVNMDTVGAEERAAKYAALIAKETDPDKIDAYTTTMENILRQGEKMGKRLKELHDAYEEIQNSDDPDIANAYDPVIAGAIKELSQTVGKTSLRNMTLEQLSDVYDVYRMVLTRVRDANKSLLDNIKESISNLASRVIGEVRMTGGEHTHRATILDPVKKFMWNNMKPVYAMEYIGSSTLTKVFNNVRSGEDVWAKDVTEAREYYLDKSKKYGYDSWDFKKKYRFQSASDLEFELTLEQILSLYAYSKREQAHDHLRLGGFVFDSNIETYKDKGSKLIKYKVNTADAHQISPEILANIIGTLSNDQKGFVDEMQDYLSTVMGAKGNEVTSKMYGVKLFKEKFYFPLKSAKQFMFEQNEVSGEVKIKNSGFTNKVVAKANNPVILSNFMEVWSGHVNDMSMYHAFTLPLEDFNRVFNYNSPKKENQPSVSVKGTIQNAYSPAAVHYVKQLITDLNGGARSDSTTGIINKLMGLFKKGSVFASLSVVVQQPSAIARAAALVDTKYFIGPKVDHKRHKALWDEVKQYAPVAIIKEMGYFDTNMGKSTQDFILGKEYSGFKDKMKALVTDSGFRDEALSKAPALADELAWCSIWEAVKRETKANYPGLDAKSEPFLMLCGSRFTEVITKTQVYDSVLSRSGHMRSKDTGMKMATAFMAEPTTSINMVTDALLKGKRGNKKYARGAIGAVIASQILNSILVSFVYAGRDDDEDETYWEKYIGTLSGQALDSLNPAGYIPFIKDIMSIVQGYDVERSDMAVISDLWKAWENLSKDYISPYRKVEGFVGSVAQIFGLPVKNIMRDARGIYQTIDSFVNGQQTTKAGIGYAVKGAITGKTVSNDQQLYEAIISGDQAQIARVKGRYEDQSSINSAIRKALRTNDPRIHQAAVAWNANDLDEYMRIAKQIIGEKHFVQDDVVSAIRSEASALEPDTGTSGTSKAKGLFTAEKFAEAIAQGDQATANAIKLDLIQTAQTNGKTEEEAEKSFANTAKGDLKELFLAGTLAEAKAVQALTAFCGETQSEAEQRVSEWEFEASYGFKYDDKKQMFMEGDISASDLKRLFITVEGKTEDEANSNIVSYARDAYEEDFFDRGRAASIMIDYGGLTEEEAESKLQYIDVKKQFPDTYVDDAWVAEYYKEVESSGISIEVFVDYRNQVKSMTGESKKEKRMAVINSMPISNAQKDALYFAEGWAASRLYEAPWR